jgi:hypothetical protein
VREGAGRRACGERREPDARQRPDDRLLGVVAIARFYPEHLPGAAVASAQW